MKIKSIASEKTSLEKLIQSAEFLFAARGFNGVSVREIACDTKINSALVGYYFRNKEGLLAEVYTRHCEPLKRDRVRLLAGYTANENLANLERVLEAFIRPSLQAGQGSEQGRSFSRLRAILSAENSLLLEQLVAQTFDESNLLFIDALSKCLPDLTREDVFWRFHFLLGGIYYTATGPHRIRSLSKGKSDPTDPEATTKELIVFAAAGFKAPSSGKSISKVAAKRQSGKAQRDNPQRGVSFDRHHLFSLYNCVTRMSVLWG